MSTRSRVLLIPSLFCIISAVIIFLRVVPPVTPHLRQAALDIWIGPLAAWFFLCGMVWWILNYSGKPISAPKIFLLFLGPPTILFASCTAVSGPPYVHSALAPDQELLGEVSTKSNCHYRLYYFNNGPLVSDMLCLRKEQEYGPIVLKKTLWWLDEGPHSARFVKNSNNQASVLDGTSVLYVIRLGA